MFNNICVVQKCVRISCCQIREKEMGGREKSKGAIMIDRLSIIELFNHVILIITPSLCPSYRTKQCFNQIYKQDIDILSRYVIFL